MAHATSCTPRGSLTAAGLLSCLGLVAACGVSDGGSSIDVLDFTGKADQSLTVTLTAEQPTKELEVSCTADNGCRLDMRVSRRSGDWFDDQPGDFPVVLARISATSEDELLMDELVSEVRGPGGGWEGVNDRLDYVFSPAGSRLAFELGPEPPEVRLSLNVSVFGLADEAKRDRCHEACDAYSAEECTPWDLTNACHTGCSIIVDAEADVFLECTDERTTCDTFCFYAMPRVVRFSGGCEPGDYSNCPFGFECVADVCIPEP